MNVYNFHKAKNDQLENTNRQLKLGLFRRLSTYLRACLD